MLFLHHKNYFYIDSRGKAGMKGVTLKQYSYPKASRQAVKELIRDYLTTGGISSTLEKWRNRLINTDDMDLFTFSIKIQGPYTSSSFKKLLGRFGPGIKMFYVRRNAPKKPKPSDWYETIENWDPDRVDRNWYLWHACTYIPSVLGIEVYQGSVFDV